MASILAFVASLVTVAVARKVFGYVTDGRFYTVGFFKYDIKELT